MYQRPGVPGTGSAARIKNPGRAADFGPEREHIFTHYFVGGNSLVPALYGDQEKVKMAGERLKNAALLKLDSSQAGAGRIIIKVENIGAGHYLPTGLTNVREMWLEIMIKNGNGDVIYKSGVLDKNNYLPEDIIIYNTVFGDGRPVLNISKAKKILKDRRIPPLKSLKETIELGNVRYNQGISLSVRLLYRGVSQKITDDLFGKGKINIPVIEMAKIERNLSLKN